jgi:hypothetical protein
VTRLKWKLVSIHFETVLVLVQDRCTVCAKCTIGSEIVLDTQDDTPGDETQIEARFGSYGDSANLESRQVHGLRRMYRKLGNHFGRTR